MISARFQEIHPNGIAMTVTKISNDRSLYWKRGN